MNPSELIAKEIPLQKVPWEDTEKLVGLFYRAFQKDPFFEYLQETARSPEQAICQNFRFDLARGKINGVIFRTSNTYEGAALWHLNGFPKSKFILNLQIMQFKLKQFRIRDIRKLLPFFYELEKAHMTLIRKPHYYLSLLGVDPNYHGQRWGSKLIRPILEHADKNRKICYLETVTEKNVAIYRHFGFEVVKTLRPDFSKADFHLMLRKPDRTRK
jgi:ribosomal protein S18 acetylase RimI-like enzyme